MDHHATFEELVENNDLNEIFKFFVNSEYGNPEVETYLRHVRALTILCGNRTPYNEKEYSFLRSHYNFQGTLIFIVEDRDTLGCDVNVLTSLMPNITELCLVHEDPRPDFLQPELLLAKWKKITKLMVKIPEEAKYFHSFLEKLNVLESLETLVIYDYSHKDGSLKLKKEPFLARLKHLYFPHLRKLSKIQQYLNLKSLGFDFRYHVGHFHLLHFLLGNLQDLFLFDRFNLIYTISLDQLMNFLDRLLHVCRYNLRSLKIYSFQLFEVSFVFVLMFTNFNTYFFL